MMIFAAPDGMTPSYDVARATPKPSAGSNCHYQDSKAKTRSNARTPLLVPICILGASHREVIAQHLLSLPAPDRYLRFGYNAHDAQVQRYVDSIDFARDDVFGIYNRRLELVAMAHLAYSGRGPAVAQKTRAEFGVSVLTQVRGRGYGARLFDRAIMHARNQGVNSLFIHALSENTPMLKIARNAGATVERDGGESEAHLVLPAPNLDSQMAEIVEQHFAEVDYSLKQQTQRFLALWAPWQE